MYESHNIGWNFWPWKKVDTATSPTSIEPPEDWDQVIAAGSDPTLEVPGAAGIFDQFLLNMSAGACAWNPDIVAALLGERPAIVPAWGFGVHGAQQSFSSAVSSTVDGIRVADAVRLAWATGGEHPANPFEQTDGRAYAAQEELVVRLHAGDWLEFEMTGVDPASVRVVGCEDATRVERSQRGIRVRATADATVSRLVMESLGN